jgi:hypothetical protein
MRRPETARVEPAPPGLMVFGAATLEATRPAARRRRATTHRVRLVQRPAARPAHRAACRRSNRQRSGKGQRRPPAAGLPMHGVSTRVARISWPHAIAHGRETREVIFTKNHPAIDRPPYHPRTASKNGITIATQSPNREGP